MAFYSQQYGTWMNHTHTRVNEVSTYNLECQISELTALVQRMVAGNVQAAKVCGLCSRSGHITEACPYQHQYDPYYDTYNPEWRDHSILSYGDDWQPEYDSFQKWQPDLQQVQQQYPNEQAIPSSSEPSLEDAFKAFMTQAQQYQQETIASIHILETQESQLATTVGRMDSQLSRELPSQIIDDPKENVSTLRSGAEVWQQGEYMLLMQEKIDDGEAYNSAIPDSTSI